MTGQIPDEFLYKNERYAIAGISGGVLFNPADYDLITRSASSACWRGYQAFYNVVNNHLVVDTLYINLEEEKMINGKKPKKLRKPNYNKPDKVTNWHFFKLQYPELMLKLDFTGTVLIAKDFIDYMYVHMGFQSAHAYETVIELKFVKGKLVKEVDKSELMAKRREEISCERDEPISSSDKDVQDWIADSFNLDYESDEE